MDDMKVIAKDIISLEDIEEIGTTDPMVVLGEKGINITPRNFLLRAAVYDAFRDCTVLPLQIIKTYEREMNIHRVVYKCLLSHIDGPSSQ